MSSTSRGPEDGPCTRSGPLPELSPAAGGEVVGTTAPTLVYTVAGTFPLISRAVILRSGGQPVTGTPSDGGHARKPWWRECGVEAALQRNCQA